MKVYPTDKIRNIALVSHSGAGKTTFVERMLLNTGAISRMGTVSAGNTACDFEPEEVNRNSSISTSIASIEFRDGKLNLFDTPGYMDFIGEVYSALHVCDSAVVFIEAVSGVEVGTEIVYAEAKRREIPMLLLVNKMDRETVRVSRVMNSIQENLLDHRRLIRLQIPIGEAESFTGVIDLVTQKAYMGADGKAEAIPAEYADEVKVARMELIEAAAEGDDTLMEKFFEEDTLSADEIIEGLKGAMAQHLVVPIIFCAGEKGIGTHMAAAIMQRLLASPLESADFTVTDNDDNEVTYPVHDDSPLCAFVFKTREDKYGKSSYLRVYGGTLNADSRIYDMNLGHEIRVGTISALQGKETSSVKALHAGDIGVVVKLGQTKTGHTVGMSDDQFKMSPIMPLSPIFSYAIHPVSQADISKLSESLHRLMDEDATLQSHYETATHESILSGMGDVHLNIAVKKLESKFGVHVNTTTPKIPYRETITSSGRGEHTHKKQSGGAGQYGRVMLNVESISDDDGFEFSSKIVGGALTSAFISATEKGCLQAVNEGPLAGVPITGVKAIVYDGKMHAVDSKEIAFQVAGREALRKAMLKAGPVLLEPLYNVTITIPSDNMGDIMSDLNTRRASVQGMDQIGPRSIVKAEVPLAEMQRYLVDLRSMTQGRGVYSMDFSRYGRIPGHQQQKVINSLKTEEA